MGGLPVEACANAQCSYQLSGERMATRILPVRVLLSLGVKCRPRSGHALPNGAIRVVERDRFVEGAWGAGVGGSVSAFPFVSVQMERVR
eukprot:1186079-Prorocentrum_minimum.AAC.1